MGLGKFLEYESLSEDLIPAAPAFTPGEDPTRRQLFQSRLNRGVNIGSWFVLEKWITPGMFPEDCDEGRTSELDAVQLAMEAAEDDVEVVREKFETHWREWMVYDDWSWLKEVGATAVRVPIGFWMVDNGEFCDDTPFEDYKEVYSNAWDIFKEMVLDKAAEHDIGVVVDLHGLPGAANECDHSGTCSGEAALWDSNENKVKAINILDFLADELSSYDHVVGLQILNEALYEHPEEEGYKEFYLKAIHAIRDVNKDIPIIISDGWDINRWVQIIKDKEQELSEQEDEPVSLGVIIDTHVYKCFSDECKGKAPRELVDGTEEALPDTQGQVDIMVGEFSCVLDGSSWDQHDEDADLSRDDMVREYGSRQCSLFNKGTCGFYFWTYKFGYGGGGEWCFREMMEKGALNASFGASGDRFPSDREPSGEYFDSEFEQRSQDALNSHSGYWNDVDGERDWEHWRFEDGFKQGWEDSKTFDWFYHSELGRKAAWRKIRENEHVKEKGEGEDIIWVWRQAYDQGVQAYLDARWASFHD